LIQGTKSKTLKRAPLGFEVALCGAVDTGSNHDAWSYKTEIQANEKEDDVNDTAAGYIMPYATSMTVLTDSCSKFLNLKLS
jgi:ABC-type molybdate transport system substrate-binding protein